MAEGPCSCPVSRGGVVSLARSRKDLVELAGMAEQAERFQDMAECMKAVVRMGGVLSREERSLFSVAFRKLIGKKKVGWRAQSTLVHQMDGCIHQLARQQLAVIEKEIEEICTEAVGLVRSSVLPQATQVEERVSCLQMEAEFHHHLISMTSPSEERRKELVSTAEALFEESFTLARTELASLCFAHPTFISVAASYTAFLYKIVNVPERAIELAKEVFDNAISDKEIPEAMYQLAGPSMRLLRDSLICWLKDDDSD